MWSKYIDLLIFTIGNPCNLLYNNYQERKTLDTDTDDRLLIKEGIQQQQNVRKDRETLMIFVAKNVLKISIQFFLSLPLLHNLLPTSH